MSDLESQFEQAFTEIPADDTGRNLLDADAVTECIVQGDQVTITLDLPADEALRGKVRGLVEARVGQIDAINTVIRSHYTPLYSRLGPYDRSLLDREVFRPRRSPGKRTFFEYWGHECSILPIEHYPLFRWRMAAARDGAGARV